MRFKRINMETQMGAAEDAMKKCKKPGAGATMTEFSKSL